MKKVLLFLAFVLVMQTATAQLNDIYLSDDVVLSDNQWHFDDYSVIEATGNNYLVITPNRYYYCHLPPFSVFDFEMRYGDRVRSYKPYVYNNAFGWYVNGVYHDYFYCPVTSVCIRLSYVPVFYNFYYHFNRHRHIDLRCWHWRPHGHYHHLWKPPHRPHHHYDKPHNLHNGYDKSRPPRNDGFSRPHNGAPANGNVRPHNEPPRGGAVKPNNQPPRNPNVSRPSGAPQRGNSYSRPSSPPTRNHSTVRQTPPSRSSSHSRPSSSRSSNNQRHR
ncbi:MAG: hypothetical protein IJ019_03760 [Alphaproteobacteria bacterium]|nr:hypothetical protein [Alphaproteobacteria bacterium]